MILMIVGVVYFSACAGFLVLYRRALRRTSLHSMAVLPLRRNNVIPFRRKAPLGEQPEAHIESVNSIG